MMLRKARQELVSDGLQTRDLLIKCFVKSETSIKGTDPRNISSRSDHLLCALGPVIAGIEKAAHNCEWMIKGLSPQQRHERLEELIEAALIWEVDFSRLDMTVDQPFVVVVEYALIIMCLNNSAHDDSLDSHLIEYFKTGGVLKGISPNGIFYMVNGTRASGDPQTSMFNAFVCSFAFWICLGDYYWHLIKPKHEGDDGFHGIPTKLKAQCEVAVIMMNCLGFAVKSTFVSDMAQAIFCGRRHYHDGIMRSHSDIPRCLSKFHISFSQLESRRALLAKAMSYYSTDMDTPIIGQLCHSIIKLCYHDHDVARIKRSRMNGWERKKLDWFDIRGVREPCVSSMARQVASDYDGICVDEQLRMERELRDWLDLGFIPDKFPCVELYTPCVDTNKIVFAGNSYPHFY